MYLSIIIPLYNGEKTLNECLTAIFSSHYRHFEVIIVDDGSQDNSLRIAGTFPCTILQRDHNQGAAAARNWGARNATGDVLVFIDADIVIGQDTLDLFVDSLKQYPAVFGIYTHIPGTKDLLSLYQNFYAHKSMRDTKEITAMFYSYCAAISRELFNAVGGFDESWVRATFEDVEFGMRVGQWGYQIHCNKNIKVVHHNHYTLRKFIRNYYFKSLDLAKFMFSKKKLTLNNEGWTNYKNLVSFLTGLSTIPLVMLSLVSDWFLIPLLMFLAIFLAMNLDFYTFILREKPGGLLGAIILNFFVQVISFLGMSVGLASYWKARVYDKG
jgi:glycosyltransferase involved in cell wall biosynthesis